MSTNNNDASSQSQPPASPSATPMSASAIPTIDVQGVDDESYDDEQRPNSPPSFSVQVEDGSSHSPGVSVRRGDGFVSGGDVHVDEYASPEGSSSSSRPSPLNLPRTQNTLDVPSSIGRRSRSPSPSSGQDDSDVSIPPSPTLSNRSSVNNFTTSVALRENNPDANSGISSLSLLDQNNLSPLHAHFVPGTSEGHGHMRKLSAATFASTDGEATVAGDHDPSLGSPTSAASFKDSNLLGADLNNHGYDFNPNRSGSPSDAPSRRTSITIAAPPSPRQGSSSFNSPDSPTALKKGTLSVPALSMTDTSTLRSRTAGGDGQEKGEKTTGEGDENPAGSRVALDPSADPAATDPRPFAKQFGPYALASLVDPKNLEALREMGGVDGLLRGLGSDRRTGLNIVNESHHTEKESHPGRKGGGDIEKGAGDGAGQRHERITGDLEAGTELDEKVNEDVFAATTADRQRVYGHNILPIRQSKSLLLLMWLALKDKVLVLLTIAAVVSLALGLFQDFGTTRPTFSCGNGQTCTQAPVDWVEGVAIMVAVIIVVVVGSINDWQKERQFKKLNEKKEDRTVKVIRAGAEKVINIKDVVVGDIALLEPGEVVPCDGVFLTGHNVKCDESGITGESDAIKKMSYEDCIRGEENGNLPGHTDCFVISGSKVLEGVGSYVVIAVGTKSFNGRIMMALRTENDNTPLQIKLNNLAELIAKLGSLAGLVLFVALLIRFFVQLGTGTPVRSANEKGLAFVQILIIAVTLIVVAVPEGLPLAVTLALAFATKRMTKENLLVRVLGSCETMANASVICTDKTGTLTQNSMTVVAGSVGINAKFVQRLEDNKERTNAGEQVGVKEDGEPATRKHPEDFSIDQSNLNSILSPALRKLFNEAIAVNSTAFEDENAETGKIEFVGNKTETALLKFSKELGWEDYHKTRDAAEVVQMIPFSSERKAMGVVVKMGEGHWRLYIKGASEILTKLCARHVVVSRPGEEVKGSEDDVVETREIDALSKDNISRTIIFYANQTLRTIAICYKDFESWPPFSTENGEEDDVPYDELARDLTLIGITGIEDPLREGVREAVASCLKAGVTVKMCTGDNVLTARSIALQCGIFTPGGIIMEGPVFRQLEERDMNEVVPRLQVLARSSPEDKRLLVEKLKDLGEIVGVTGDGTNDGPALKTAHVGFSMGIAGTEVAKEASDIILMDDNFSSIVKAIMWGRCVNDAVRKFLQFQISVNITAVIITFVTAVASAEEESALSAVQLLWINIIMDTFAALALATDPATPSLLDRKPDRKTAPLFNVDMYKQIFGQAIYQTIVILVFHFAGNKIFNYHSVPGNDSVQINNTNKVNTLVFNAFVFMQIFNSLNARRIDNKLNIFEGILNNYYFMGITLIEIGAQVLIVFVGGNAFQVTKINGRDWGISLALGFMSIPIGFFLRLIPNPPVERLLKALRILKDQPVLPTDRPDAEGDWNPAISQIRDNLNTFANVRGGRMRASSFVGKSRSARLEEAGVKFPSLMTMVPTIVASSIGAGWAPQHNGGSLSDPASTDPSRSSAALWEGKLQLHPGTPKDDIAFKKWGAAAVLSTDGSK